MTAGLHLCIHRRLKEPIGGTSIRFGPIQCQVGILQDIVRRHATRRRERYANADPYDDLMVV
jgi:hypothetical protein